MFNFSLSVCKQVVCRRPFRLISNDFAQNKWNLLSQNKFETGIISKDIVDQVRPGVAFTTKYLKEMKNTDDIHWDWLTKKLEGLKISNIPTKIFQACIRLDKLDVGQRYYDYLVEKGVKLSPIDLMFFSKLLVMRKSEINKHEQLLIHLYNDIKYLLQSNLIIRQFLMEVFVEIPFCFKDIIERGRNPKVKGGFLPVVEKALELNMPDAAFTFMNDDDICANTSFIEKYVNFCIKRAEEGKFSKDLINRLINMCQKKAIPFSHENLLQPLNALVSVLNKYDSYQWSVQECELNEHQKCSKCGLALLPNNITIEEFERLKEYFFRQSFIDSSFFLSSTKIELRKFLTFLKTAEEYTVVLDGLNLLYKTKRFGVQSHSPTLRYFLDKGHKVLTIGRKHIETKLKKGNLLGNKNFKSKAQFFFTSNVTDDDVFLLYAALHGGPGTFFLTGDYLTTYTQRLDDDLKLVFFKWQLSHQYLLKQDLQLVPPRPHCGLPQLTLNTDKQFIWHLSQQITKLPRVNIANPLNWYCLKAEKKS